MSRLDRFPYWNVNTKVYYDLKVVISAEANMSNKVKETYKKTKKVRMDVLMH